MISDEMLSQATMEYEQALLGALPEDVPPHTFSKGFEKKMARICRKKKHSSAYTAFKRVACAMIVVALLGSTAVLSSAEGHATVMGWINMVSRYFSSEESLVPVARTYDLSGLPDEYTLCERQEIDGGGFSVYLHKSGDSLIFNYQFDPNAGNFRMKFEDHIDITLYAENENSISMRYVFDLIDYLRKNTRNVKVRTAIHHTDPVEVFRVSNKMFWGETISHVTIR